MVIDKIFETVYWRCPIMLSILLLISFLHKGGAISCYTCSSRNESDNSCFDPYNPANSLYTEECKVPKEGHVGNFPANFCLKIIGKKVSTGEHLVIRACILESMDNQCGVFKYEDDSYHGCILTCEYDGCNVGVQSCFQTKWIIFLAISVSILKF